ncbi:MAG: single-stranded DNA-binding protein [Candidatus Levybacteria bacterium]|nr:single-stranded DNA-binding protein [Candidatus Levybacteria bacterium]
MARSLNRVQLIGNLTRDPELRYTPNGTAVCSFGLATNRSWKTDSGEKHDEAEFHNIVAWNKLAELCSQFLVKGRKVFVEGRLATRTWTGQDGAQRNRTEIVISDMILLDSNRGTAGAGTAPTAPEDVVPAEDVSKKTQDAKAAEEPKKEAEKVSAKEKKKDETVKEALSEEVTPDDIPF